MNREEALGRITDPEIRAYFEKVTSDQNSYITQLEKQLKELKATAPGTPGIDSVTAKYLEKNMRRDVINEAESIIVESVGKEVFDVIKPDWIAFLDKSMPKEKTTVEFAVDAFNLVYGRCFAKKDHPVHNIGKTTANPTGTPTPNTAGTNSQSVAQVQTILNNNQPPVMTSRDNGAISGIPGQQGRKVNNTRDAFAGLKERFQNSGGNRFQ